MCRETAGCFDSVYGDCNVTLLRRGALALAPAPAPALALALALAAASARRHANTL